MNGAAIGGLIGAGTGALLGAVASKKRYDINTGKWVDNSLGNRIGSSLGLAFVLGHHGASIGARHANKGRNYDYRSPGQRSWNASKVPTMFKNVKSQQEAKKLVRDFVVKNHPDKGGDTKKFQDFMASYQSFQKSPHFPKTAHILVRAFFDELVKIG